VLLGYAQSVGLRGECRGRDYGGVRVLGGQAGQDGVVAGDRVDLALLEEHQAAGMRVGAHVDQAGERLQLVQAGGPVGGTDLLALEVLHLLNRRSLGDQDFLAGLVVLAGEVDLLPPGAGDGHRPSDDVDTSVGQGGDSLRRRDDPELDLVGVAEDGLRDSLEHLDVEALDLAVEWVA